jgi:hypothetical protein
MDHLLFEQACRCDPRFGEVCIEFPIAVLSEINEIISREVRQDYSMSPLACNVVMTASRICAAGSPSKITAILRTAFAASTLT